MSDLDPSNLHISGRCLIQSSAGTGKTYSIVSLVLRLLLGQNERRAAARSYRIDEILMVTFTNAATGELRHRLHQRLHSALAAFATSSTADPFLGVLLERSQDQGKDLKLLQAAAEQIDQAAIFTIHGFCRLMLTTAVFESGISPQQGFILDDSALKRAAVQDFWRREIQVLPTHLNRVVRHLYANPDALLQAVSAQSARRNLVVKEYQNKPLPVLGDALVAALQAVQIRWQQDGVRAKIEASRISTKQLSGGNEKRLNLMDRWAKNSSSALLMVAEDGEEYLSVERLACYCSAELLAESNLKQAGDGIEIAEFLAAVERSIEQLVCLHAAIYKGAIKDIQAANNPDNNQEIGMDGLIRLALEKLQGASDSPLATQIRTRYPMAFIDEFQDTDPIQWEVFDLLYPQDGTQQSNHALIMIGDPKQSIFAFRGADINAYLRARKSVAADKLLNSQVNWRSSVDMIAAINALYSENHDHFANEDIRFSPVQPQPHARQGGLRRGAAMPALTFWYHQSEASEANMANAAASAINLLLDGKTEIHDRALQPEDITCLVRSRYEADSLHKALLEQGLGSIRRNRNSVLDTDIARSFKSILAAALAPADRRPMRTALACPLLNIRLADLYREINEDETAWERHVERFERYQRLWRSEGIMVMLHRLLLDYGLDAAWLQRHQEHARSVTDLRQIAELLQQQSLHLGSMRKLYRWFSNAIGSPLAPDEFQMRLESDANLVQITTVQTAKGLQYEVVVLPFGMHGTNITDTEPVLTHGGQGGNAQPILSINPDAATRQQHLKEQLGENLRLLYVALTRAKCACFVGVSDKDAANPKNNKKASKILTNPIRHLLLQPTEGKKLKDDAMKTQLTKLALDHEQIAWCPAGDPLGAMQQNASEVAEASAAGEAAGESEVADASAAGEAAGESVASAAGGRRTGGGVAAYSIAVRSTFAGHIDRSWGVTSYSRLIATQALHAELVPGWQDENHPAEDDAKAAEAAEAADEARLDLAVAAKFPKGAAAGLCLHDMLEHWPPQQKDEQQHVQRTLLTHNLWQDGDSAEVLNWLRAVRTTPLDTGINLANLTRQRKEMSFYFPMRQAKSNELCRILSTYGYGSGALAQEDLQGMMHGYIDLAFEHQGKLWVLDYKSNWLGAQQADYSEQAMEAAIKAHRYDLQFLIYSLALYRLLRWRYPEAEAAGKVGVYYLFLRGMNGADTTGLYRHQPEPAVLIALDRFFAGDTTGC